MFVKKAIQYLQPMQCTFCGTVIQIEEKETTRYLVNPKGLPINSDCVEFEVKGVCPKCHREYEVEKQGMLFNIYNATYHACPHLKAQEEYDITFGLEI